jgi:hypothetical protein
VGARRPRCDSMRVKCFVGMEAPVCSLVLVAQECPSVLVCGVPMGVPAASVRLWRVQPEERQALDKAVDRAMGARLPRHSFWPCRPCLPPRLRRPVWPAELALRSDS